MAVNKSFGAKSKFSPGCHHRAGLERRDGDSARERARLVARLTGAHQLVETPGSTNAPDWAVWLVKVQSTLHETSNKNPILFYGTDWLAFGHFVIAIVFIGAIRDPVRNRWLFDFGLIACVSVIPFALVFGGLRGIPFWWRLIDCSFGVFGFILLWFCRKWTNELEQREKAG